ncbi:MAG: aromatic ring-hydroxylating dioxygenase subunit alpha [Cyanobacteria bacterium P01_H01_bin.58]
MVVTPSPSTPYFDIAAANWSDLRALPSNPHHWYVVGIADAVQDAPVRTVLWGEAIALFRDASGPIQAVEARCPHRHVQLSQGEVVNGELECIYHGWRFDTAGTCTHVPYLVADQKLPTCKIRSYPVRELNGFIWLYPGDCTRLDSQQIEPMGLPEWDHLNYIVTVSAIDVAAHYSFLMENLMDMYHGRLHQHYQPWAHPILRDLTIAEHRIDAHYDAQSYYRIDQIWSVAQLFFPAFRQLHPENLDVSYVYPHWFAKLGQDFKICCLLCPVSPTHTKGYLIHFTSLQAFHDLHKLPVPFRRWLKNRLFGTAQTMLNGILAQDVTMLEQEQAAYHQNPQRRGPELNRALISVQKFMREQARAGSATTNQELES